jgi:hypothetical protein
MAHIAMAPSELGQEAYSIKCEHTRALLNGFFFNLLSNYMSSKSGKIQV